MSLFTDKFIDDIHKETSAVSRTIIKEMPLWKIDFELEMLSILNFYVTHVLCYHFIGHYPNDYRGGTFLLQNLQKGDILQLEPKYSHVDINIFIPLNQQGKDFQGGGFSFLRYVFLTILILLFILLC